MSDAMFPTLPGLSWNVLKTPEWKTVVQRAASGKEVRTAYRSRPIWNFSLSYEVLRGASAIAELQTLMAFFNARQGSFDSFLFNDESDNLATAQPFGVGDGVRTAFTMVHDIGGWTEPIGYSSVNQIFVNGVLKTYGVHFNATTTTITFFAPPAAGAVLTWSGAFYYRVRFAKDSVEFDQFMKDLWQLKKCELVGVI